MIKGLVSRIKLVNGSIRLSSGIDRVSDCIWFYSTFDRFYPYDFYFGASLHRYEQKSAFFFNSYKNLIVTNLQRGIERYIKGIKVNNIDIGYLNDNRKETKFKIEYSLNEGDSKIVEGVQFI